MSMGDDLAAANVNRSYQLAASSIAIFTFLLFFLYPRFASGEVSALRYQATLIVMGVATFSFAFASFYYYGASLGGRIDDAERTRYSRRGDRFWLLGCVLLFLAPSMILFTVRLLAVASVWFALWLVYVVFVTCYFPRVRTAGKT
jgi:Na+/melibiose symporter-like transporter